MPPAARRRRRPRTVATAALSVLQPAALLLAATMSSFAAAHLVLQAWRRRQAAQARCSGGGATAAARVRGPDGGTPQAAGDAPVPAAAWPCHKAGLTRGSSSGGSCIAAGASTDDAHAATLQQLRELQAHADELQLELLRSQAAAQQSEARLLVLQQSDAQRRRQLAAQSDELAAAAAAVAAAGSQLQSLRAAQTRLQEQLRAGAAAGHAGVALAEELSQQHLLRGNSQAARLLELQVALTLAHDQLVAQQRAHAESSARAAQQLEQARAVARGSRAQLAAVVDEMAGAEARAAARAETLQAQLDATRVQLHAAQQQLSGLLEQQQAQQQQEEGGRAGDGLISRLLAELQHESDELAVQLRGLEEYVSASSSRQSAKDTQESLGALGEGLHALKRLTSDVVVAASTAVERVSHAGARSALSSAAGAGEGTVAMRRLGAQLPRLQCWGSGVGLPAPAPVGDGGRAAHAVMQHQQRPQSEEEAAWFAAWGSETSPAATWLLSPTALHQQAGDLLLLDDGLAPDDDEPPTAAPPARTVSRLARSVTSGVCAADSLSEQLAAWGSGLAPGGGFVAAPGGADRTQQLQAQVQELTSKLEISDQLLAAALEALDSSD